MRTILAVGLFLVQATAAADLPEGWYKIGNGGMTSYDVTVQDDAGIDGAGLLVSRNANVTGTFGGVGQAISAENYRGKKIRLSASLRTEDVDDGYAGLWVRVDKGADMLVIDNMNNRGVRGTTDWKTYECVIYVDPAATQILFGALLNGNGTFRADKFDLKIVPDDTPTTNVVLDGSPKEPRNLDF